MSRRTAEADKAIRLAWERERHLVQEGKGTRDWSEEQQTDILDPNKGKAYDNKGRAYEGQHMKSVGEYPEYQGDPGNIQFLTREEHLEAHLGSWQNPTNWYYDPVTKELSDFGLNPYTPCKAIELSNPLIDISKEMDVNAAAEEGTLQSFSKENKKEAGVHLEEGLDGHSAKASTRHSKAPGVERIGKIAKKVAGFAYRHREGIKTGAKILGTMAAGAVLDRATGGRFSSGTGSADDNNYSPLRSEGSSEHLSPLEHIVQGHSQRYHTKEGIKTIEKDPYKRGGRNN